MEFGILEGKGTIGLKKRPLKKGKGDFCSVREWPMFNLSRKC